MRRPLAAFGAFLLVVISLSLAPQRTVRPVRAEGMAQQDDGIQVGVTVEVIVDALNLRERAGTDQPVIAVLSRGEQLAIVEGPISLGQCTWWRLLRSAGVQGWAAGRCNGNVYLQAVDAQPQSPTTEPHPNVDWRSHLDCAAQNQFYDGILYCTGQDKTGNLTHVVVIDLQSSTTAFEYILPKGLSDGREGEGECRDPNRPEWGGPEGGCYRSGDRAHYPGMALDQAVQRAQEVRSAPLLALVMNADYGALNLDHGPEGLLVVRGVRLDGADRCDDDYNGALRPWLGLGSDPDAATGLIPAAIDRLATDSAPLPQWIYTGIGGGPWLIRDGAIVPGAADCVGEKVLHTLEPVTNCTGKDKATKPTPLQEWYTAGSCRAAPHTAAGISSDGRWLFFVITTGQGHPDVIAEYMRDALGVWQAIKFDGGGSSKLAYHPQGPEKRVVVNLEDRDRALTNYLGVYAAEGKGIRLPLQAEPVERVHYRVLIAGETAQFNLEFRNSGSLTWHPDDQVELRRESWFLPTPDAEEALPLSRAIAPGEVAVWPYEASTNERMSVSRFRMYQKGESFGPDMAVIVVTLPQEWADRRQEIEQKIRELIEEWKRQGEEKLEALIEELKQWLEEELKRRICPNIWGSLGLLMGGMILLYVRSGRRPCD